MAEASLQTKELTLMEAMDGGDPAVLQVVLNATQPTKFELAGAMLEAVRKGDNATVLVLLESGKVGPGVFDALPTILVDVAAKGHTNIAKMLLNNRVRADQVCLLSKKSALHEAARLGNLELCSLLVEAGVWVNAEDNAWVTPVMFAAMEDRVDIIKYLVKNGAMINLKDKNGESALSKAVDKGNVASTETLLRLGADCNLRTQGTFSNTMLHIAAKRDNPEIMKLLLNHSDKYDGLCNMLGQTPFDLSLLSGGKECIDLLLERGADPNRLHHDWSPLMRAAFRSMPGVIESLLRFGADVNTSNLRERTALHKAVEAQCVSAVHILLEAGADANADSREGYTPLHIAAMGSPNEKTFDIILELLRSGANVNAVNYLGQDAKRLALADFYFPTVRLLHMVGSYSSTHRHEIENCSNNIECLVNFLCGNEFRGDIVYNRASMEHNVRYLHEATHSCRSLQNMCCIFVRKCLLENIAVKVEKLPLPADLKQKINFQDVQYLKELFCLKEKINEN